ncbi:amino acid ABC transporter membrane protein, PAAT family [Desulfonauticus submarinus]|uniref:Putative glutamine transport system permease protein GlnP n=1 Tax=Desulfonauticus submarinus TaxID=206665 RepID=A0A1H0EJL6_9BACT|nr:amino acid ABC transporter permease [Desulfonauticus submarinus]SDN82618.1 amino acid ABC transporter membrane protein, PAAT family [Desulfonauticus submarinus]
MYFSGGMERPLSRGYKLFWQSVFVFVIFLVSYLVYFASQSVEYTWRWYRIPQYFYYKAKINITSPIEGEIIKIEETKDAIKVCIKGEEKQVVTFPKGNILLDEGDYVYPGDKIGWYEKGKPGLFLIGLFITLKVSCLAIVLGIIIGLITGLARISKNPACRYFAITYIEIIRGSPLLVQIFLWYFVVGTLVNAILAKHGFEPISPLWYGVISLAIFAGAYIAEIVRAGIQSVSKGQMEAARSLGLSYSQAMRKVILPQAFRRILPPLAGQFISLIKDSSLLGVISIRELTKATREIVTTSLQPFEMWIVCALLYLVLTFTLSMFVQYLERKAII